MSSLENITVIGSGLMGRGIAQVFACNGHTVQLMDVENSQLQAAKDQIEITLRKLMANGFTFQGDLAEIISRINLTTDMAEACQCCDIAVEAVFEKLELKQRIFQNLDALCPLDAVLCSNTSVISITEIAELTKNKERVIGTHWWNPPYLIPLVEVIRTENSSGSVLESVFSLLQRIGKHPIRVEKDVPGFVANRLQHALWREAFHLIDEGICDPETVDEAISNGFGLRLPILGPVENTDMVGLDLVYSIHDYILKHLSNTDRPSSTLTARKEQNQLGFKTKSGFSAWTDEQIAASREKLETYLMKAILEKEQ